MLPFYTTGQRVLCEGNTVQISCSNKGKINVVFANYGRLDSQTCPGEVVTPTNCGSGNSLARVQGACQNKDGCQLTASNIFFAGDPCKGTKKYLLFRYQCD